MKKWFQLARITVMLLTGCYGLAGLTGCESLQDTSFAPLGAKLEPIPGGGAHYFVAVNTSGQTLHNIHFEVVIWSGRVITPGVVIYTSAMVPPLTPTFQILPRQ